MTTTTPSAPAPGTTPAPTPPPTGTPSVSPSNVALSPTEVKTVVEWTKQDLARGKISQDQADKIFADMQTPPEERGPDARTDDQKLLDQHFPVANERDYTIRYYTPGQEPPEIPKEVKQFDANARAWMHEMGLPREFGNSTVNVIAKDIQHRATLSPAQREAHKDAETDKLRTLYGGQEKLNAALAPARDMILELDERRPGLKAFIEEHGDNAMLVAQLIQAARIYHARKTGR